MNIGIIGFGISGANILKNIIDHRNFTDDINIHIFERRKELGVGIAYEDDSNYKLLNSFEKYMTLDLDNPNHIYQWMDENSARDQKIEGMLPRPIFGQYIKDTYSKYIENENVHIHKAEVTNIIKDDNSYKIYCKDKCFGQDFSTIFLSIGQSYYRDSYNLMEYKDYINNPYPLIDKLTFDDIGKNSTIGIIGCGPTSVDIYRFLQRTYKLDKPVYFFTKTNAFLPTEIPNDFDDNICSIDNEWIEANKNKEGFVSLEKIIKTIEYDFGKFGFSLLDTYDLYKDTSMEKYEKAIKENDQALGFCQHYTMILWNHAAKLYNSLSGLDRKKVDEEYLDKIDFLITKTPYQTMKKLIDDYKSDKLKIIRDTSEINYLDKEFLVKDESGQEIRVDKIINAQGFEKNLDNAIENDTLLRNLYNHKFIEKDLGDKFIRVTYPSYNLINKKYGIMDDIYLTGMWAGATDILNNDLRSILRSSQLVANDFMDKLSK